MGTPVNRVYTDIHVHAVPRAGYTGHDVWERTVFRFLRQEGGITDTRHDPATTYITTLHDRLAAARRVNRAVLLALDGAYDHQGRFDAAQGSGGSCASLRSPHWGILPGASVAGERSEGLRMPEATTPLTRFHVPNDDVVAWCQQYPDSFLFGASVHPHRPDALEELTRCKALGAVLVKWIPNSQNIDPADRNHIPFYRKLAELGLPLLSHTGIELVLPTVQQSLGKISRLRLPLEEGVTVIAAHGGSSGLVWSRHTQDDYLAMLRAYPNFYGDTAALGFPSRMGTLLWWRDRPDFWDRLLFGTDYPVPFFNLPWRPFLSQPAYAALVAEHNPFDRMALLLEGLGIHLNPDIAARLLGQPGAKGWIG